MGGLFDCQRSCRDTLPGDCGYNRMGVLLLPSLWSEPGIRPPGTYAASYHPVLRVHFDFCVPDHLCPTRRRDRRFDRNATVHHGAYLQRCHAGSLRSPGILDLHVPGLSPNVPDRGNYGDGVTRENHSLFQRGDERVQPSIRPDLRRLHGSVPAGCPGGIVQSHRDTGMRVLPVEKRRSIPRVEQHLYVLITSSRL